MRRMKNFLFVLSAVIVNPPHAQARDGRAPLAPQNGVRDLTAITATIPRIEMCRKAKESRTWTPHILRSMGSAPEFRAHRPAKRKSKHSARCTA
jgi:hypothetical protein